MLCLFLILTSLACKRTGSKNNDDQTIVVLPTDTVSSSFTGPSQQSITAVQLNPVIKSVSRHELVDFGRTLIGVPYYYASSDPSKGFDCSGFITYVFNHFNIEVPRSSVDFTNTGTEVNLQSAKEGDLILFTGTIDSIRVVGHMGIVTENADTLKFIHATSGKANGVTVSLLNEYYKKRFVKITRVFAD